MGHTEATWRITPQNANGTPKKLPIEVENLDPALSPKSQPAEERSYFNGLPVQNMSTFNSCVVACPPEHHPRHLHCPHDQLVIGHLLRN